MANDIASQVAVHEDRLNRHSGDIKRSFEHIGKLEDADIQRQIDRNQYQSKFEEMSAQLRSLRETVEIAIKGIEKVDQRIDERLSFIEKTVNKTHHDVEIITNRIDAIEGEVFSWVKVSRWLGSWKGVFVTIIISALLIGAIFPDARQWISSLIKVTTG